MTLPRILSAGAYGKVPSQGDFLRVHCESPAAIELARWLEEGVALMRQAKSELTSPVYFLFRAPQVAEVLLGALAPSVDQVGRQFPLAVFGALDGAAVAEQFPSLPTACARFLGAAAELVAAAPCSTGEQVTKGVHALPIPAPEEFSMACELRRQTLRGARSAEPLTRLFAEPPQGRAYYAFRTFLGACQQVQGRLKEAPGVTLDCPVRGDLDQLIWLDLARRLLGWSAPPSLLWSELPAARLLLSLGTAPPALFVYQTRPDHSATALWPLVTVQPAAIESAREALTPAHRQTIDAAFDLGAPIAIEALLTALGS